MKKFVKDTGPETYFLHAINKNIKPRVLQIHLGQPVLLLKQKSMGVEPWNKNIQASTVVQHIHILPVGLCGDGTVNTTSLSWILMWHSTIYLVSQEQCLRSFLALSQWLVCSKRHAKYVSMHYSRVETSQKMCRNHKNSIS